jgi:hypothetical protein
MRKMLLDRMVNLLSRGCVVPVVKYIKQCWLRGDTDISLIRYFVTEVCVYYVLTGQDGVVSMLFLSLSKQVPGSYLK